MNISRSPYPGLGPNSPPEHFSWFHVVLSTYGTWLPGDSRGFRTRHHREHVAGDYRSPPKEDYSARYQQSAALLRQPPVRLEIRWRSILGPAIVERIRKLGGFVLAAAVIDTHVHLLVKIPKKQTRYWMGLAKKHAWFEMRDAGWRSKLWAKRAKFTAVKDRQHLRNCLRYIMAHHRQGGWIWIWEGLDDAVVERLYLET